MSREFGSYMNGYFHSQMEYAAEDCAAGDDELTRLWGGWFRAFYNVSYAIASSEAGDSGPDHSIYETIQAMPVLKRATADIESYLEPYQRVMNLAVRDKLEEIEKDSTPNA